jgi:paraquat-inducible protein A
LTAAEATTGQRLACVQCDLLLAVPGVREGERASCPRCGHLLWNRAPDALQRSLSFAVAAAVLLVAANAFPFLALEAHGLENVMTLPRSLLELYREGYAPLAAIVFTFIVAVPGLMLLIILALLTPLVRERPAGWLVPAGRLLFQLSPWSMVEVFVIGVIVSLVKIHHMAHVVLGLSFWSYVGFAVCFTAALAGLDRLEVWRRIERCTP